MGGLSAFFAQNAIPNENVKYVASKRFVDDETGKPMEWEIRCLDAATVDGIRNDCTKRVPVPGKRNVYQSEVDRTALYGKMAVTAIVFPNLHDVELQNSYGVMGAETLLRKMLSAGEYDNFTIKVSEVCGYDESFEDEVDDAKN